MKKILLAAAFCAIASLNSIGAPCANGLISTLAVVPCQVGASNQWTLSTFSLTNAGGLGYASTVSATDIFVSFSNVTSGGGGAGFAVAFSDAAGGLNFFSASSVGVSQSQNWATMFMVETGPAVQRINNSWQNANVTNPQPGTSNGSISVTKVIRNASVTPETLMGDVTLLAVPGLLIPASGSADVPISLPNSVARLGVTDNFQIQAGVNGTSSLNSYTNTFYAADPQNPIPEPITFVLMGAGLIGIAALRRRNG